MKRGPYLAWTLGTSIGAAAGVMLGPYDIGWGVALAFPALLAVLSIGALREGESLLLTALRAALGMTIGFAAATIPVTLVSLGDIRDPRIAGDLRAILAPRWAVMLSLVPLGAWALARRHRVERRRAAP
jgi:hypothetical protein